MAIYYLSKNSALKRWFSQREKNSNRIEKVITSQISKLRIEARLQAKGDALTQIGSAPTARVGSVVGGPVSLNKSPARVLDSQPERR